MILRIGKLSASSAQNRPSKRTKFPLISRNPRYDFLTRVAIGGSGNSQALFAFPKCNYPHIKGDRNNSRVFVTKMLIAGVRGVNGSTHVIATREMRVRIPSDSMQTRCSAVEGMAPFL